MSASTGCILFIMLYACMMQSSDGFSNARLHLRTGDGSRTTSALPHAPVAVRKHVTTVITPAIRCRPPLQMASTGAGQVDTVRIATYFGATAAEVLFITAAMGVVQIVGAQLPPLGYKIVACIFFAAMSLKSRVFAVLDARRPELGSDLGNKIMVETKRPSWTPPGVVFPFIWSTIGILRTVSSMLIWEACGRKMLVLPLVAMVTHLAIGDTWNCINNVEQRKGTAVAGVGFVWASVMTVIFLYWQTLPLAGMVLAPSGLWLTIASVLIYSIWRLNGSDPILPLKPASSNS